MCLVCDYSCAYFKVFKAMCGNRDLGTRKRDLENQILTKGSK